MCDDSRCVSLPVHQCVAHAHSHHMRVMTCYVATGSMSAHAAGHVQSLYENAVKLGEDGEYPLVKIEGHSRYDTSRIHLSSKSHRPDTPCEMPGCAGPDMPVSVRLCVLCSEMLVTYMDGYTTAIQRKVVSEEQQQEAEGEKERSDEKTEQ